jgi:hypothetical protein
MSWKSAHEVIKDDSRHQGPGSHGWRGRLLPQYSFAKRNVGGSMNMFKRWAILVGLFVFAANPAFARNVTDSAGRIVEVPDKISRVFAAGPPASVLLYVLAPEDMIGWVRTPRDAEKAYLLPRVRDLPETTRLLIASSHRQAFLIF